MGVPFVFGPTTRRRGGPMADLQRKTVVTWQRDVDPSLKLIAEITDDFTLKDQMPAWRVQVGRSVHRLRMHHDGIADENGRVHPD